jgi:uncharacterized protein YcbK (DUF882 family)
MNIIGLTEIAPNLRLGEIVCPCCRRGAMHVDALAAWKRFRLRLGRSIKVTSGFRCAAHNTAVGGEEQSRHLIGLAFDMSFDRSGFTRGELLAMLVDSGFRGIGWAETFVHADARGGVDPAFWGYSGGRQFQDPQLARDWKAWREGRGVDRPA